MNYKSQHTAWVKSHLDVLAEMKNGRFYLVPEEYMDEEDNHTSIILSDIVYWNKNFDELNRWCIVNSVDIVGFSLKIYSPQVLTAFILRWS